MLHLAALVSVPQSMAEPVETLTINTGGTANVLEAAHQAGLSRFVLASTCAVYGDLPGRKDEQSPTQPLSPYAASKLLAEQWAQLYTRSFGLPTAILRDSKRAACARAPIRPTAVSLRAGVRLCARGNPAPSLVTAARTCDFVSVHDVAAANLLALTSPQLEVGEIYTVSGGHSASLRTCSLRSMRPTVALSGGIMRRHAPATFSIQRAAARACKAAAGVRVCRVGARNCRTSPRLNRAELLGLLKVV